jgi:hypothetical protein
MKTKSFTKKTYEVYDNNHFVLYFNEQESGVPADTTPDESTAGNSGSAANQLQYEYDTCLAEGLKDDNGNLQPDYGLFVSALIRSSYSQDQVEAITQNYLANSKDADAVQAFNDLQAWRAKAKQIAKDYGLS